MTITIRPMKSADRPGLIHILNQIEVFNEKDRKIADEVLDTYLVDGELSEYRVLVALHESLLAGFVCFGPTPLTEGTWDIYWLAVDPKVTRQGIGRQLTTVAEKEIINEGGRIALIETSSRPEYDRARSFYAASGYNVTAHVSDFYAPGDDKLIYMKRLNERPPV